VTHRSWPPGACRVGCRVPGQGRIRRNPCAAQAHRWPVPMHQNSAGVVYRLPDGVFSGQERGKIAAYNTYSHSGLCRSATMQPGSAAGSVSECVGIVSESDSPAQRRSSAGQHSSCPAMSSQCPATGHAMSSPAQEQPRSSAGQRRPAQPWYSPARRSRALVQRSSRTAWVWCRRGIVPAWSGAVQIAPARNLIGWPILQPEGLASCSVLPTRHSVVCLLLRPLCSHGT
jgi:hypothetical protein